MPPQPARVPGTGREEILHNRNDMVCIGRISKSHGTRGEVRIISYSDFPERFKSLKSVFLETARDLSEIEVEGARFHNRQVLLKLAGIENMDDADRIKGALLLVDEKDVFPLPEGHYYHFQLLGLSVVDEEKGELGPLTEIIETGANDVYVVDSPRFGEVLIPVIPQVVLDIDLASRLVRVRLLPGLIDEERTP